MARGKPGNDAVSRRRRILMRQVLNFYNLEDPYGEFSNFAPFPVQLHGKHWPTSEHYFQAQKHAGTPLEDAIRQVATPREAFVLARSQPARSDWEQVKDGIMREAVLAKFTQHARLRELLLSTGDASLCEHTENDHYWGDGGDGNGKNRLGQILMSVREQLRSAAGQG
jgi:ribA/ribD-fused uncharacterized protein